MTTLPGCTSPWQTTDVPGAIAVHSRLRSIVRSSPLRARRRSPVRSRRAGRRSPTTETSVGFGIGYPAGKSSGRRLWTVRTISPTLRQSVSTSRTASRCQQVAARPPSTNTSAVAGDGTSIPRARERAGQFQRQSGRRARAPDADHDVAGGEQRVHPDPHQRRVRQVELSSATCSASARACSTSPTGRSTNGRSDTVSRPRAGRRPD